MRGYVAAADGKPIGYVQVYRVADFPAYLAAVGDAGDDAAIDVLIGEIEYTGRGLGRRVIAAAVEEIVWPVFAARRCYACPAARQSLVGPRVHEGGIPGAAADRRRRRRARAA